MRFEFAFDGGDPGAGGTGTLFVNDAQVGQGRIDNTVGYTFSLDEGMDVGMDLASPVSEEYADGDNAFTGTIDFVQIDIGRRRRQLHAGPGGAGSHRHDAADKV